MREGFLKKFIGEERYLQNPPLITKDFIKFCEERGIKTNEDELEFFEKEGLLYPILRSENPRNSVGNHIYIPFSFQDFEKDLIMSFFEDNKIFDPSKVDFKPYSSFKDKELKFGNEKVSNYYSSFQIYWLEILKNKFSFTFNFASKIWNDKKIESLNDFIFQLNKRDNIYYFDDFLEMKKSLKDKSSQFQRALEFLLSIQEYYYPYGRSASRTINIKLNLNLDSGEWWQKRENFDPKKELKTLNVDIEEVSFFYWLFSKCSMSILGVERDDWIQLWKSIAWNEKDELKGDIRLGIEYLQWALMLKRFIEDYIGRDILDIDEIKNVGPSNVLKFDPSKVDSKGLLLRVTRNNWFKDPVTGKSFHDDRYKRLFYLANDFGLDYHPRLIVFVEGKTELEILPRFFEFLGSTSENLGIDFVNIGGINQFFGKEFSVKNSLNKYDKLILNNFLNLINYTLNKWQTLPFFVGDNENNIKKFLKNGISVKLSNKLYPNKLPKKWYHIWDKDFELDNFTDEELAIAINQVLNCQIDTKTVENTRKAGKGIKSIDKRVDDFKIAISDVLFKNLVDKYTETEDESILDRPVFELIKKLKIMALENYPPTNTIIEAKNKEYISYVLDEKEKDFYKESR